MHFWEECKYSHHPYDVAKHNASKVLGRNGAKVIGEAAKAQGSYARTLQVRQDLDAKLYGKGLRPARLQPSLVFLTPELVMMSGMIQSCCLML